MVIRLAGNAASSVEIFGEVEVDVMGAFGIEADWLGKLAAEVGLTGLARKYVEEMAVASKSADPINPKCIGVHERLDCVAGVSGLVRTILLLLSRERCASLSF